MVDYLMHRGVKGMRWGVRKHLSAPTSQQVYAQKISSEKYPDLKSRASGGGGGGAVDDEDKEKKKLTAPTEQKVAAYKQAGKRYIEKQLKKSKKSKTRKISGGHYTK